MSKTHYMYRDSRTGLFLSKEEAMLRNPSEVVKERIPNPGRGDTK